MAANKNNKHDFFDEAPMDPVETATGYAKHLTENPSQISGAANTKGAACLAPKKKAGFYLSVDVLERFTLKFHELKLAGVAVDNKSTLLELALAFALDDLDKGKQSHLLQKLQG